ncbi:helix-turn-helix domain-containing protein [Candidatus Poriferisocius sp.]|uniref:helix-turn-helix domain-containing protein n=1 Tax=Candidatus Poriferisocius sp. TaxID=3101276 RepID=UPI003B02CAD0
MAKKFKDLAAPLYCDPKSREQIERHKRDMEAELFACKLVDLRQGLGISQTDLVERLGISQAGVSKLERSADPKLSTMRKLTEALGGTLHIEVRVGGRSIELGTDAADE